MKENFSKLLFCRSLSCTVEWLKKCLLEHRGERADFCGSSHEEPWPVAGFTCSPLFWGFLPKAVCGKLSILVCHWVGVSGLNGGLCGHSKWFYWPQGTDCVCSAALPCFASQALRLPPRGQEEMGPVPPEAPRMLYFSFLFFYCDVSFYFSN